MSSLSKIAMALLASASLFATPAFADSTIGSLTPATTPLAGTELIYCTQGGADRKCATSSFDFLYAINAQVGTTYTVLATDEKKLVTFSNAASIAVTLPQATGSFAAGFCWAPETIGAGTVTITPTTSTINGVSTLTLATKQGVAICSDGANWQIGLSGLGGGAVSGPGSSTNNDVATFNGVTGAIIQDGGKVLPTGQIVGTTDSQTITNKNIAGSEVNSGTVQMAQMPAVVGGPGYITGASMFYGNPYNTNNLNLGGTTSAVPVANSYYCTPFWIYQTVTIKALAIQVATLSAGNTNNALQGAVYNDLLTTGNVHRPGTLIDFAGTGSTTGFNTSATGVVSTAMANGTDTIVGPAMIWTCVQAFDTTVKYTAFTAAAAPMFGAVLGSATLGRVLSGNANTGFSTTGTAFGGTNWVAFTSSTTWTESAATALGPLMAIQVN